MPANNSELEKRLWAAADTLRANSNLNASQYSAPVLGLIFLRYVDAFFAQLISFAQGLTIEEQRGIAENLSEEELAVFDLLTRPNPKLNRAEQKTVREVARQLLDTLKAECLVLDWRKQQRTRAGVMVKIQEILDKLPEVYAPQLYEEKCQAVYQHVYDAYPGAGKSLYQGANQ